MFADDGTPVNGTSAADETRLVLSSSSSLGTPDNPASCSVVSEECTGTSVPCTGMLDSVKRGVGDGRELLRLDSGELKDFWAAILAVEGAPLGRCVTRFFFFGLGLVSSSRPSFNAK